MDENQLQKDAMNKAFINYGYFAMLSNEVSDGSIIIYANQKYF